jgi:hypothetical protein
MQVDRRTVLKAGSALLLLRTSAPAERAQGFIYDERFPEGRVHARLASRQGMWVQAFEADVTDLWLSCLRPHWTAGRGGIAGITNASALFCLEQMAREERYRVLQSERLGTGPHAAVRWLIDRRSSK